MASQAKELRTYLYRYMQVNHAPLNEWPMRTDETSVLTQDSEASDLSGVNLKGQQNSLLVDYEGRCRDVVQVGCQDSRKLCLFDRGLSIFRS